MNVSTETYQDVIAGLQEFYNKNTLDFFIPSLQTPDVDFMHFCRIYDSVIRDTMCDDVDISSLSTIDRVCLALQHRLDLSSEMSIILEDRSSTKLKLAPIKQIIRKTKIPKNKIVTYKGIKITVAVPHLEHDNMINSWIFKLLKYDNKSVTSSAIEKNIEKNSSDLVLLSLSKYIKNIVLDGKTYCISDELPVSEFIEIVKKIPATMLQRVAESIISIKKSEIQI